MVKDKQGVSENLRRKFQADIDKEVFTLPGIFHMEWMESNPIPWTPYGLFFQYFPVPPPIPAGLARVLQDSSGLCPTLPSLGLG